LNHNTNYGPQYLQPIKPNKSRLYF